MIGGLIRRELSFWKDKEVVGQQTVRLNKMKSQYLLVILMFYEFSYIFVLKTWYTKIY